MTAPAFDVKKLSLGSLAAIAGDAGTNEVTFLRQGLSQPTGMAFLYSTLGTVNTSSGVVDSVVDRLGLAPNIQATLTARPAWDGANLLITGDGVNDRLAWSANNAIADLTSLKCLVGIGTIPSLASAKEFMAVADSAGAVRLFGIYRTAANAIKATSNTDTDSTVVGSANRRLIIATQSGTTQTIQIPNVALQTGAITALASGSNNFTIFDYYPGAGANMAGSWRASIGLTYVPTAGDVAVLTNWATTYHAAVLA